MEKLKIYLGDITYDTVSLSTDAIPLAIGYVAAYCKKIYGSRAEITLFKYLEDLEQALVDSPPDILGLSNYSRGLTYNTLELNSDLSNPEFLFKYDIEKWNSDSTNQTIDKFELNSLRKIMFTYTSEEIELFRNNMDIYGITTNGMAQVLKRVPKFYLWRKPITIS